MATKSKAHAVPAPVKRKSTVSAPVNDPVITVEFGSNTLSVLEALVEAFKNANVVNKQVAAQPLKAAQQEVHEIKKSSSGKTESNDSTGLLTKIRELISAKAAEQKTKKIVALLGEFGVQNASGLEDSMLPEFYNKLKSL